MNLRVAACACTLACGVPSTDVSTAPALAPRSLPPAASLDEALTAVVPERLRADVEALADDELLGRATPSPGLDRAAEHIATRWRHAGLEVLDGAPEYRQTFRCGRGPRQSSNVVGMLRGGDPALREQAILVTAHYDHIGEAHREDDGVYNGANDNASGVAAATAIAEAFSRLPAPTARSIVFIAFCGEELGLRGSEHWVSEPLWSLSNTAGVVNLEMLGRPDPGDPPRVWITGHALSSMPAAFVDGARFVSSTEIGPAEADTYERSDNFPFSRAGVVAHTFAAGRLDELYHSAADEADHLDYDRMAVVVRALAIGIHRLANATTAPTWSDAGKAAGYAPTAP